ncbi:MAG: hypothetical protein HN580_21865 [Deltaproteobacteria bacterium]|nr:hypothetical protein [Deltaproteobacteria bacterium]
MKNKRLKNTMRFLISFIVSGTLIFAAIAAFSSQDGVIQKFKGATQKLDPENQVQASIPLPKNIVKANMPYQGGVFYTDTRKSQISKFKCSSCHGNKEEMTKNASKISHADIVIQHGGKDGPDSCNACHSAVDRDFLTNINGNKIDMDHAYDMCGQCHFRQKKDWIGGAHGKRIDYWAGQRVVNNCTSCHNPHTPRFEKRWPATYSVPLKK